jgi:hypothetical protein
MKYLLIALSIFISGCVAVPYQGGYSPAVYPVYVPPHFDGVYGPVYPTSRYYIPPPHHYHYRGHR